MECTAVDNAAFYHPRDPRESPLFRLLEEHYEEFERVCPERYQGLTMVPISGSPLRQSGECHG